MDGQKDGHQMLDYVMSFADKSAKLKIYKWYMYFLLFLMLQESYKAYILQVIVLLVHCSERSMIEVVRPVK